MLSPRDPPPRLRVAFLLKLDPVLLLIHEECGQEILAVIPCQGWWVYISRRLLRAWENGGFWVFHFYRSLVEKGRGGSLKSWAHLEISLGGYLCPHSQSHSACVEGKGPQLEETTTPSAFPEWWLGKLFPIPQVHLDSLGHTEGEH